MDGAAARSPPYLVLALAFAGLVMAVPILADHGPISPAGWIQTSPVWTLSASRQCCWCPSLCCRRFLFLVS